MKNYIENYFKDARIGDEVVDIIDGVKGKIVRLDYPIEKYPIEVEFETGQHHTYTLDGRASIYQKTQRLFYKGYEPKIEIPKPPKKKFKFEYGNLNYIVGYSTINNFDEFHELIIGENRKYLEYGRIRKTKLTAEEALKLQTRVMRLHALAEQINGLKEFEEKEESNFTIMYDIHTKKYIVGYAEMHFEPEKVYMTEECADKICEMLNNGEFSLEVENE